jgi:hypothetical protein
MSPHRVKPATLATKKTTIEENSLHVKDSSLGVGGVLVLGGVTDEALLISESHVGGSDTVSLVVGENLNLAVLHHTNTTRKDQC